MPNTKMPWATAHMPTAPASNLDTAERMMEEEILQRLAIPLRTAVKQAFSRAMGTVARGQMDDMPKRPKEGTKCAIIWSNLDAMRQAGNIPKLGDILEASKVQNLNEATTRTQYAMWRKFNGIPAQQKPH